MSVAERLDAFQRRHRWAGLPLAVLYKFGDDQGFYLAALITYYGFISLFPLLLLLVSLLGYALQDNPELQQLVLNSALSQFPVIGNQLGENVQSLNGNAFALVIGILGSLYGGLGVALAGQHAMNTVWAVPRAVRPDPFRSRGRSLLVLVIVGTGLLLTTALSGLTTATTDFGDGAAVDLLIRIGAALFAIALNASLFILVFRVLTARKVPIRDIRLGAILAAIAWQSLQVIGTYYVGRELATATATYGLFGIVLGLLAWIYLEALVVVLCAEVNVVRAKKLWPRSLLTPFTDNVQLTDADRRAYTSYARSERHKGFQRVEVDFDQNDGRDRAQSEEE
ncbi:MAG: YihY/virulence factor BrkB family protein [Pseudonocardiaceae bacterium]